MVVVLAFLAFVFVAALRSPDTASAPRRSTILVLSVAVALALMTHRFA